MTLRYALPPSGAGITIAASTLTLFDRFRQRRIWQREAGGQLFARFDGAETIVVDATPPSRSDRRWRTGFVPNPQAQLAEIRQRFEFGLHFVGDWHSHPEPVPWPSQVDLDSMKECFRRSKHDLKSLVLVVIGTRPFPEGLWIGIVSAGAYHQLQIAADVPRTIEVTGSTATNKQCS